jgi:hypothetical protein
LLIIKINLLLKYDDIKDVIQITSSNLIIDYVGNNSGKPVNEKEVRICNQTDWSNSDLLLE